MAHIEQRSSLPHDAHPLAHTLHQSLLGHDHESLPGEDADDYAASINHILTELPIQPVIPNDAHSLAHTLHTSLLNHDPDSLHSLPADDADAYADSIHHFLTEVPTQRIIPLRRANS